MLKQISLPCVGVYRYANWIVKDITPLSSTKDRFVYQGPKSLNSMSPYYVFYCLGCVCFTLPKFTWVRVILQDLLLFAHIAHH